ncbi:hypothetical protein UFOVP254_22 [uncultured Caudovirales phage]|uniref:Uncharacterized protein n=1 Tax=uncultured Caudovirales phage TaxID=2100421 RepID=A0A6J5L141_9CAUD|nr:hypothetical protein UFOVP76_31 [uncultured Caudovirales phage]CAB4132964.1 hypothetical protein UFOVP254_22 [uncultured Caudovirales phage]
MDLDTQHFINTVAGIIMAVLGWFARELWSAVKELQADLARLREELPKGYVAQDDYREDMRELKNMLARIFDKLDAKVDR